MFIVYTKYICLIFDTLLFLTDIIVFLVLINLVTKQPEIENIYDLRVFFVRCLLLGGRTNATH